MNNTATIWVASRSSKPGLALEADNLLGTYIYGRRSREDAELRAMAETMDAGKRAYVYEVEVVLKEGYELHKEVRAFDPTK